MTKNQTVRLAPTENDKEDRIRVSHQELWFRPNKIDLMSLYQQSFIPLNLHVLRGCSIIRLPQHLTVLGSPLSTLRAAKA